MIYDDSGFDRGYDIEQLTDSGFIFVGDNINDIFITRINKFGDVSWTKKVGDGGSDNVNLIQMISDTTFLIAGSTKSYSGFGGSSDNELLIVKMDITGNIIWSNIYGGSLHDIAFDIDITNDGNYVLTGSSFDKMFILKIDNAGNIIWGNTYGGSGFDRALNITTLQNGNYLLTGYTRSFGFTNDRIFLIKVDDSGSVLWAKTYGGDFRERGLSAIEIDSNEFIISGWTESYGAGNKDACLLSIDKFGNLNWARTYGLQSFDHAIDLCKIDSQLVIAINHVPPGRTALNWTDDLVLLKTDLNGNMLSSKVFKDSGENDETIAEKMKLTADNKLIIVGTASKISQTSSWAFMTIKVDANLKMGCNIQNDIKLISYSNDMWNTENQTITPAPLTNVLSVIISINTSVSLDTIANCKNCNINLSPSFDIDDDKSCLTDTVYFINKTSGGLNFIWAIDTFTLDTSINSLFNFNSSDTFTVTLNALSDNCSKSISKKIIIIDSMPISNYNYNVIGMTVSFFDSSIFASNYFWNFGDGDTSSLPNPTHFFTVADTYNVCLIVEGVCGFDTLCKDIIINCSEPTLSFDYTNSGTSLQLNNQSFDGLTWHWDFGDGDTSNFYQVNHEFIEFGIYSISLSGCNFCGCDTIEKFINIGRKVFTKKMDGGTFTNATAKVVELKTGEFIFALSNTNYCRVIGMLDADGQIIWVKTNFDVTYALSKVIDIQAYQDSFALLFGINHITIIDKNGELIKRKEFGGITINKVIKSKFSGYLVAGTNGDDNIIMKLNNELKEVWSKTWVFFSKRNPIIAEFNNGDILYCMNTDWIGNCNIVKIDSTVNLIWGKAYDAPPEAMVVQNIFIRDNKSFYTTGAHRNNFGEEYVMIVKYNSIGQILWNKRYEYKNGPFLFDEEGRGIEAVMNDTCIYICAGTEEFITSNDDRCFIITTDTIGNVLTYKYYKGDIFQDIIFTSDNGLVMMSYDDDVSNPDYNWIHKTNIHGINGCETSVPADSIYIKSYTITEQNFNFNPANYNNIITYSGNGWLTNLIYPTSNLCYNQCQENLEAIFVVNQDTLCLGDSLIISNLSIQSYLYKWYLNDTLVDTISNPFLSINKTGSNEIKLLSSDGYCWDTSIIVIYVIDSQVIINYGIERNGLSLTLLDSTLGGNKWLWDFGDGDTSAIKNPTHFYSNNGKYLLCLQVDNGCIQNISCDTLEICGDLNPKFDIIDSGLIINFIDSSYSNVISWHWEFGDGDTSNLQSPEHTFLTENKYKICLTAKNSCGNDSTLCDSIMICPINSAFFGYNILKYTVSFTDSSLSTTNYMWDFGDSTSSTLMNPIHNYQDTGNYYACLTTFNSCYSDSFCNTVYVADTTTVNNDTLSFNLAKSLNYNVKIIPNPYKGNTNIEINLNVTSDISIEIYDLIGTKIYYLKEDKMPAGKNSYNFSAVKNGFPSGVYLLKIMINNEHTSNFKLIELE